MRVLVTGATGCLGPAVVNRFLTGGHQVAVLARSAVPPALFRAPVAALCGDLTPPGLEQVVAWRPEVVVHLAAILHVTTPSKDLMREYEEINVGGTIRLAEMMQRCQARRLVFASTINVYGHAMHDPATETSCISPDSPYARSKLRAEAAVTEAVSAGRLSEAVVLRFAAVCGPRMKGNYRALITALASRRFVPVGPGRNRRTLVSDLDAAEATYLAATLPQAVRRTYNVADVAPQAVSDIIRDICSALGRRPPRFYVPTRVATTTAVMAQKAGRLCGRDWRLSHALTKYLEDVAVDAGRIRHELGFAPRVAPAVAWKRATEGVIGTLPKRVATEAG